MFGKLFRSMYDGTLAEDWRALVTLQQFVVLADVEGVVEMTQEAIIRRTGIPAEVIAPGIEALMLPDDRSRTEGEEGRRIVPLDGRGWGWRVVNYAKYRATRDAEDRRRQTREATARWRSVSQGEPSVSRGEPRRAHAEGEGDGEGEGEGNGTSPERREDGAPCPSLFPNPGSLASVHEGRSLTGAVVDAPRGRKVAARGGGARSADDYTGAAVEEIPLAGGEPWVPTVRELEEWVRLFPGVDVVKEFRAMRAWSLANPRRRKTLLGVRQFVQTWLNKQQNEAGGARERGIAAGPGDRQKERGARAYREHNS